MNAEWRAGLCSSGEQSRINVITESMEIVLIVTRLFCGGRWKAGDVLWLIASLWCVEKNILGRFALLAESFMVSTSCAHPAAPKIFFRSARRYFCCVLLLTQTISKVSSSPPSAKVQIIRDFDQPQKRAKVLEIRFERGFYLRNRLHELRASKPAKSSSVPRPWQKHETRLQSH